MSIKKECQKIIEPAQMQDIAKKIHKEGKSIGFVPTMGYFHEGHLSLMRAAREQTNCLVVSIFVNPIQFGPSEDFNIYPRDVQRDLELAKKMGVDILFTPEIRMIYPPGFRTKVEVEGLSDILCGKNRPGHFMGVATVVCKLFNIIRPEIAYFGQKDAQQAIIVKKMVEDLDMDVHIKVMPTIRERDGLAMSSRNIYLSDKERKSALCLFKAITLAQKIVNEGERDVLALITQIEDIIRLEPLVRVEYISILNPDDLSYIKKIEDKALLTMAIKVGKTRLIDNTILKTKNS